MPAILIISGWRLFFYSNKSNEPIHEHAEKSEMECKFRIDVDNYDITEANQKGTKKLFGLYFKQQKVGSKV